MNSINDKFILNDANEDGEASKFLIVHNDDVNSTFGDDDALLSLAPKAVEVPSVDESGRYTVNTSVSIKSSELRDQNSIERKLKFDDDASSKHSRVKIDFDSLGLIGRQSQTTVLRACFDRIRKKSTPKSKEDDGKQKELVLVAGESGCGKTSTVKTLEEYMELSEIGVFVEGKFEINLNDEPYSGISKAIAEMCRKTCVGSPTDDIRKKILNVLHDDEAQLLVHLVPALADIVSMDPKGMTASRKLDVHELENKIERLKHAFRLLIRVFCETFAPLVLFLDDLQWADVSSLQVIDYLMSDKENGSSLMIIGAYRSDEVDENSLLHNKILALRDKSHSCNFHVTEVEVPVFDQHGVLAAITAIFSLVNENDSLALAELCVKRTLGNPFFVLEFLKMIYHEGLIEYSDTSNTWTWELSKIEDVTMSTANVVVLLQDRMRRLSRYAQMFLRCAAYLGSTFKESTLEIVWKSHGMPMTIDDKRILPLLMGMAMKDNFIEECGSKKYRWVHDKLQEAAFDLLEDVKVSQFDIGRILYYSLQPSQLEQDLFAVVDLINNGNIEERKEFAGANLQAAEKALGLSAFKSAARYASHGIDSLKDSDWSKDRQLKLNLYTVGADAELVLGNVDTAERYIKDVLDIGDFSTMETLPLMMTKVKVMTAIQMRFDAAVDCCLEVLKSLDFKVTARRRLLPVETVYAVIKTVKKLKMVPKDFHKHIGVITDPKQKAIAAWTATLNYVAYRADDRMLSILAACKIVDMSLKYGLNDYSGESVATIGGAVNSYQQDYKTVQSFMELALFIQDTVGRTKFCKTTYVANVFGLAWTREMSESLPHFNKGYIAGMQLADTAMATWCLVYERLSIPFLLGRPLDQIERNCSKVLALVEEVAQPGQAIVARIYWQMIIDLSDSSNIFQNLEGEVLNPTHSEDRMRHMVRVFLYVIFSQYEAAAELAIEKGDSYFKTWRANISALGEIFYRAVALYAAARETKKNKYKKAAKKLRKRIVGWQKAGNPNVKHFVLYLDAESAALDDKLERAKTKYVEAIAVASRGGYLQYEALFKERYADWLSEYATWADEAKKRWSESILAYREWGAHAKVAQMMGDR